MISWVRSLEYVTQHRILLGLNPSIGVENEKGARVVVARLRPRCMSVLMLR
jgi:hypothetical protein